MKLPRLLALGFLLVTALPAADAPKLNVLFIAVDDLRPEINASGSNVIKTPNLDRIAAKGTTFDRAYCQQAVCSPSRSSHQSVTCRVSMAPWRIMTSSPR